MRIPSHRVVRNLWGGSARRRAAIGSTAVAVSLLAVQVLPIGTANAFDGPNGHHQFVQISTKGAPTWGAHMDLYAAGSGEIVYSWNHGMDSWAIGGKETWWFTANEGDHVSLHVFSDTAVSQETEDMLFVFGPDRADGHCLQIDEVGHLRYTGDSKTGGCNPE
jgi:hypothetical protein